MPSGKCGSFRQAKRTLRRFDDTDHATPCIGCIHFLLEQLLKKAHLPIALSISKGALDRSLQQLVTESDVLFLTNCR